MDNKIYTYDSTLRDGSQAEGISFSLDDKLKIAYKLDSLGIDYIEAGNPASNPKDLEFFHLIGSGSLKHAKLVAFGSTHRVGVNVEQDENVISLLRANTPVVAIFGKSWDLHVKDILKTSMKNNLEIIKNTVRYFKQNGKEVIFDAEHFFDGYKHNPAYAIQTLLAAQDAGADWLVLCDTNGGCFTDEISETVRIVKEKTSCRLGIHCHNDCGMGVANSVMAVIAGVNQVQGTVNGFGERCGNANLFNVIANLQIKRGYSCIPSENMENLTNAARYVSELANTAYDERQPYVGGSAFAHKGGMHIDGVHKNPKTFEHTNPETVGNHRRFLMSEVSGRSTILQAIHTVDPLLDKSSSKTKEIMNKIKQLEYEGYQFEGAEASVELLIRKALNKYKPFFSLHQFKVSIDEPCGSKYSSFALVKIDVDGKLEINAAEGEGPVNALDKALRKALEVFYPGLSKVRLTDYKVRVLDSHDATAAKVRVLIESSDGVHKWSTIGVSTDIIEASWRALVDSVEYKLILDTKNTIA